jgi:hypothetical protein
MRSVQFQQLTAILTIPISLEALERLAPQENLQTEDPKEALHKPCRGNIRIQYIGVQELERIIVDPEHAEEHITADFQGGRLLRWCDGRTTHHAEQLRGARAKEKAFWEAVLRKAKRFSVTHSKHIRGAQVI